jgi:hypothetical protein
MFIASSIATMVALRAMASGAAAMALAIMPASVVGGGAGAVVAGGVPVVADGSADGAPAVQAENASGIARASPTRRSLMGPSRLMKS